MALYIYIYIHVHILEIVEKSKLQAGVRVIPDLEDTRLEDFLILNTLLQIGLYVFHF